MGGAASKMCGSQNVSGPEIAGPGVGAAHAATAATSQGTVGKGTAGHGAPARAEQSVASSQAAETADPKEQIAYLLRLGLNRREVCVGHMPLERVFVVVFAAHSRLASSV
jgi:hypothetical protein